MHVACTKKVDNDDAILTQKDYSLAFAAPSCDYFDYLGCFGSCNLVGGCGCGCCSNHCNGHC
jgi:hypothetical protein